MRHQLARLLLCFYVALLVFGAWPFLSVPVLGALSHHSRALLLRISVLPGMAVFSGIGGAYGATSNCIRLSGKTRDGPWELLYRNECPPDSNWHDSRHQVMEYHFVADARLGEALIDWETLPPRPFESLRRLTVLGDLACHSPLLGAEPRVKARLESLQHRRSVLDGSEAIAELRCDYLCSATELAPPQCGRSPKPTRPDRL